MFRFTGKQLDISTGLYYFGYRYYDASVGRFISQDLHKSNLWQPQTIGRYAYVLNNPLRYIDPNGLQERRVTIACEGHGTYTKCGGVSSWNPITEGTCLICVIDWADRNIHQPLVKWWNEMMDSLYRVFDPWRSYQYTPIQRHGIVTGYKALQQAYRGFGAGSLGYGSRWPFTAHEMMRWTPEYLQQISLAMNAFWNTMTPEQFSLAMQVMRYYRYWQWRHSLSPMSGGAYYSLWRPGVRKLFPTNPETSEGGTFYA